ncbi:hypothetical protein [Noviherbaspirillum sp.]|jgi:hypothetical protein|uniref:hypothetical protein n=1 Tax=Noviherbaspirillum sp. TaxID=1926288 RepID=UPI0025FFB5B6|nr:hypothetical protein [Noviherbaspirillum sp.]
MFITKKAVTAIVIAGVSTLSGCASIVNGQNQVLSVETRYKGEAIAGATCQLDNGKGKFYVTTPGTITVHRAYDDMNVKCEKEGLKPGMAAVKSSTKPMAFGNILFGGVIGAAVDAGSGAAYDYPTLITVIMEESVVQAAPVASAEAAPATSAASTAPVAQK